MVQNLGGIIYIPLRKGRIQSIENEGEKIYIKVKLQDFIFPKNFIAFQNFIQERLLSAPRLILGDPENTSDGMYALESKEKYTSQLKKDSDAWNSITDELSQTKAFNPNDSIVIFGRTEFQDHKGNNLDIKKSGNQSKLIFEGGKENTLKFYYKFLNHAQIHEIPFKIAENNIIN